MSFIYYRYLLFKKIQIPILNTLLLFCIIGLLMLYFHDLHRVYYLPADIFRYALTLYSKYSKLTLVPHLIPILKAYLNIL